MWRISSTSCETVAVRAELSRRVVVRYSVGTENSSTIEIHGVDKSSSRRSMRADCVVGGIDSIIVVLSRNSPGVVAARLVIVHEVGVTQNVYRRTLHHDKANKMYHNSQAVQPSSSIRTYPDQDLVFLYNANSY
jgi:hypothetical protein